MVFMILFYTYQGSDNSGDDTTWGFKPNVFIAGHSTMDCQASGWDAEWQRHAVLANKGSLDTAWRMSYKGIDRANRFLAGLQNVDVSVLSAEKKVQFEAEARAIRAYNYLYLSKVFGPVPMLLTGETYTTSAGKARPENLEGTYQVIEEDLKFAMEKLDWNLPMENTVVLRKVSARHFWQNSICIRRNLLKPRRN